MLKLGDVWESGWATKSGSIYWTSILSSGGIEPELGVADVFDLYGGFGSNLCLELIL